MSGRRRVAATGAGHRRTEAALRRRFRVVDTPVDLSGRTLSILHPASAEDLIDEREFERDERLPYWAELWPSARVLAERVLRLDGAGQRLLELGCGAGLVAASAALSGFRVCATDYYDDAMRFARVNAWRNAGASIETELIDWRAPTALRRRRRFDVVVASDVLYERPYGALVATVLAATLAPHGIGLIADPGRVGREAFVEAINRAGLQVAHRSNVRYVDGEIRQTITIFEIAMRGDATHGTPGGRPAASNR